MNTGLSNLTPLLQKYKKNKSVKDYKLLYESILLYAYEIPVRISRKNIDHCGEFVLFIENKINPIIEKFEYYGNPFEAYLFVTFKAQFYSYINEYNNKEKRAKRFNKYTNYKVLSIANSISEHTQLYNDITRIDSSKKGKYIACIDDLIKMFKYTHFFPVFCRRLWLYILKYSAYLDDKVIYDFAKKIQLPLSTTIDNLQSIKEHREIQRNKKISCEQKCNLMFSKYINKEFVLSENNHLLSSQEKNIQFEKIQKIRFSYEDKIKSLNKMSFSISNEILSEKLGVPKGSIDTSIYHLRKICKKYLEKSNKGIS